MSNPVLIEVTRGPLVESRHRGAIAVVDTAGKVRASVGDIARAVFPRSAVKALQALPLIESGAADRFGFGDTELALACASHSGEPLHVSTAAAMLAAAGRGESDLECGVHWPNAHSAANELVRAGARPSQLHNNCSGKHAGFVCAACAMGVDPQGYVEPEHAVQREIASVLEAMTGAPIRSANRGVDGCSIPTYAIPIESLARAFARFVTGEGLSADRAQAARRLRDACFGDPFMVGGTGTFDTAALEAFSGRLFVKFGAEGVYCGGFPDLGLGFAMKCDDGAQRGAETMMAAVADAFLAPDDPGRAAFAERFAPQVLTRKKVPVGVMRPVAGLVESLREGRQLTA